jgi:hypothetical protein
LPEHADEADPDGVIADAETFARYLALLHLAVQVAQVPGPFAVLVTSVADRLAGWSEEVAALVVVLWDDGGPTVATWEV